ncbi:Uncharacterised protein [Bordetella trematum]|uniref:Uncharacterized protein n=1 Tax=Bordetella trematum TaxID=123899 RepID=A0A157STD8_9BORD|nr:hypothetical protein [Bordetella trematum]NNH19240.1 hypothetical protein [Bordetella trematum]CZZ87835.1 Uncharacterised protein [Bordetella trematum]SAI73594.1 Uncharacterised protein [Bordetella trematum]SUV97274.1 Uncharacterised protein [Bordetella trematum]
MHDSKWPEVIGLSVVAVATAAVFVPWDRIGPFNWEALAAVGTLATAIVAVAVPAWQHMQAKKAAALQQLHVDWSLAHQLNWLVADLARVTQDWERLCSVPNAERLQLLATQIDSARVQTRDVRALILIAEASGVARDLASGEGEGRSADIGPNLLKRKFLYVDCAELLSRSQMRLSNVNRGLSDWMERLRVDFGALKETPLEFKVFGDCDDF